jgi:acetylglutamate kinase
MVAGTTAGVLDIDQRPLPRLSDEDIERLVSDGAISAGMVTKLASCRAARRGGVQNVRIIDGRTGLDVNTVTGTIIDTAMQSSPQKERVKL